MCNQPIGIHVLGIILCGQFWPWALIQGQIGVAKLKSSHISLIIGPGGLGCENNL